MLYLDYAKQTENGYIMNFFANSVEDLEDISEGKEFVTKNGTNYGVPAPQSVVTITNRDGEKTTYLMGEDGNWIPGVVNPTDYYTKKQADEKFAGKEEVEGISQSVNTLDGEVAELTTSKQDKINPSTPITAKFTAYARKNSSNRYTVIDTLPAGNGRYDISVPLNSDFSTEEIKLQVGTMVTKENTKTLFGNQSIVGTGNIDLYRHHIHAVGRPTGNFYIDFISSKNLVVDSLTDLKTLLGDTFQIIVYGDYDSKPVLYMTESALYYLENGQGNSIELSAPKLFYTDTVTAI